MNGNTTWVRVVDETLPNCYFSPDQFDPQNWWGMSAPLEFNVLVQCIGIVLPDKFDADHGAGNPAPQCKD